MKMFRCKRGWRWKCVTTKQKLTGFHSLLPCPLSLIVLQGGDTWQVPIFSNLKPQVWTWILKRQRVKQRKIKTNFGENDERKIVLKHTTSLNLIYKAVNDQTDQNLHSWEEKDWHFYCWNREFLQWRRCLREGSLWVAGTRTNGETVQVATQSPLAPTAVLGAFADAYGNDEDGDTDDRT